MGIIYKVEAPNGKLYIGQTIHNAEKRWKEHIIDANDHKKNHCKLLNASIRKYGPNEFKVTTILECEDIELNSYEQSYIKEFNTLSPNGLNLKEGGSNGKHHDDTKKKISITLKGCDVPIERRLKLSATKNRGNLPMYVIEVRKQGIHIGYRVANHPNGGEKRFINPSETMEHKLHMALEHLKTLDALKKPVQVKTRTLPKYIQHYKHGYCVNYNGVKKCFLSMYDKKENLLQQAIQYLTKQMDMDAVQRLDGSG